MRLLMGEQAYQRLRREIAEIAPNIEVATLAKDGSAKLAGQPAEAASLNADLVWLSADAAHAGLTDSILKAAQRPGTRWMQTFNAGLDKPEYADILRAGTRICNSDAQAKSIAQFILAEVLTEWSRIGELRVQQIQRKWSSLPFREIDRSTWLIVGYGHIGQQVAQRARAFGAKIIGLRRTPAPDQHADLIAPVSDLFKYLSVADVVVIAAPLTDETRGLANAAFFKAMKSDAVVANIARGAIINETDLLAALDAGTPSLAILDVFAKEPLPADHPLWTHPRVRLSPHNSNRGNQTPVRGDQLFLNNLRRLLAGEPLINEVRSI